MTETQNYISLYAEFLKEHTHLKRPLSIVCDSSNGSTGPILEALLPQLGLTQFTLLNTEPHPDFPAHGPNPLLPGVLDELSKTVVKTKADFGVAFDADGDRAFFIDEKGNMLSSVVTGALLFKHSEPPFVADELVFQAHHHMKIFDEKELHPSRVGVFFIKEVMRETKATAGAEFSGHFYFKDFFGADSGIFTMLRVLSILSNTDQTLSQFAESLPQHAIHNVDIKIAGKNWLDIQDKVINTYSSKGALIDRREGVTVQTKEGWVNIRPSNTEPILRIYAGAETAEKALALVEEIKTLV